MISDGVKFAAGKPSTVVKNSFTPTALADSDRQSSNRHGTDRDGTGCDCANRNCCKCPQNSKFSVQLSRINGERTILVDKVSSSSIFYEGRREVERLIRY
jgi:hypothetical protein